MSFSMIPLLLYSDELSTEVRALLRAASDSPPERRDAQLLSAARLMYRDTQLECSEVLELVGLPLAGDCF